MSKPPIVRPPITERPSQKRIALVIDDEEQLLRLILRILEKGGFEVLSALTAETGLALFRAHAQSIDVTLLDVQLPDMGAAELLPRLREERPDFRLILTSGADLPPDLEQQMNAMGGRFLRKPFVPKTLLRMLEDASKPSDTSSPPSGRPGLATGSA